jgi:cytochrome c5
MRFVALIFALMPLLASAADLSKEQRAAIEARITPYSQVCVAGDDSCAAGAATVAAGPRSGEDVYNGACMACHTTGAAGAPMLGDASAWSARIAKGIDALYDSGINGVAGTGMIAKGGCGDCSDEEIQAAVDYMVASAQ